ncbi:MAG: LCP family protein [Actinomycetota bacterium]
MLCWNRKILCLLLLFLLALLGLCCKQQIKTLRKKPPIKIHRRIKVSLDSHSKEPVRILLLGSDSRTESIAGRSDAIILVQINPSTQSATLVSFPRDSRVYIPGRGYGKINSAMAFGGPVLTVRTVENYSGLQIHYYMVTTFNGFMRMIQSLGGVQITLNKPLYDRWAGANLPAGPQRLDPGQALAYCRARHIPGGDLGRAAHQQHLLVAIFEQESHKNSPFDLLNWLPIVISNCETNLSNKEMFQLARLVVSVKRENIETIVLPGRTGSAGGASYVFLDQSVAGRVFQKLKNSQ